MIIVTNNMIKEKAKEFNITIKSNIIYRYSLIYIQIFRGNKQNRKKFIQWVEDNRPMTVKVKIKETNLIKEMIGVITNRVFISKVIQYYIIISLIKHNYICSLIGILFLIPLSLEEIAEAIRHRLRDRG